MRKVKVLHLVVLIGLASLPLAALDQVSVKRGTAERRGRGFEERSELSAPVREGGRLILRADLGSVVIRPGATDRFDCQVVLRAYTGSDAQARQIFGNFQLSARTLEAGGVYVTGQMQREQRGRTSLEVEFEINLPQRFNLDVQTQGGDITIESALQGEARLTTAGGDVRTAEVSGPVKVETAGGSITLGKAGNGVDARTAGGDIHTGDVQGDTVLETSGGQIVTGQIAGSLRAQTAGGDVVIGGAAGRVTAETAGGQIQIGPTDGVVRAETSGGSIRLRGARGKVLVDTAGGSIDLLDVKAAVNASTAMGRILAQFDADKKTFSASQLKTSMGDVFVYLPVGLPLTIDAAIDAAAGHRIVSDFPLNIQGDQEALVLRTIRGQGALNGGGEILHIRTVAGNIEIRKLDARALEELKSREASSWQRWRERWLESEQRRLAREQQRLAREVQRKVGEQRQQIEREQERRAREIQRKAEEQQRQMEREQERRARERQQEEQEHNRDRD